MSRKRLSKEALVERICSGMEEKGWDITRRATRAMLDEVAEAANTELGTCGEFAIPDVAILKVEHREARQGRNPATGESIDIAAKNVVRARPVKKLRDLIAGRR